MATEPQDEPPKLIKSELERLKMSPTEFITTNIGETFDTISISSST